MNACNAAERFGQRALKAKASSTSITPAILKRTVRKLKGSTCGADSLATMKPVAHITTNDADAAAIQFGCDVSVATASGRFFLKVGHVLCPPSQDLAS